jgi:pilus assembly protein Flp/PilA
MKRLNSLLGGCVALIFSGQLSQSLKREEGQTLVEYALILAFIALVVLGAVIFLGSRISSLFNSIGSSL